MIYRFSPIFLQNVMLVSHFAQFISLATILNVNMATSSDSVLLEGLGENSVYSVSVIAIAFDLTRTVRDADIITLVAGEYTGSYLAQ